MCFLSAPTGAPSALRVSPVDSDKSAVMIEWEEVECIKRNGHVTGYRLRYAPPGSNWTYIDVDNVLMTMVTEMLPSTNYSFQVAVLNNAGEGIYSNLTHYHYTR